MKNTNLISLFTLLFTIIMVTGCGSSKPKVEQNPPKVEPKKEKMPIEEGYTKGVNLFGEIDKFKYTVETVESSPNAKSVSKITSNNEDNVEMKDPDHHPSENQIIYTEVIIPEKSGKTENITSSVWSQNPDSKARVRITESTFSNGEAIYSESGDNIIFSSARSNSSPGIWKIKSDGLGGIVKLTEFATSNLGHPTISKLDQISFHSFDPRYTRSVSNKQQMNPFIWIMKSDGSIPTQLRYGKTPSFSPDGNTIVFTRVDEKTEMSQIFTMSTNGGKITQLTFNTDFDIKDPEYNPEGSYIVYASNEGNKELVKSEKNDFNIWIMNSNGTNKTQLTTNGSFDDQPVFSPSGNFIYFRSNRGGHWNIWRFEPVY